MTNEKNHLVERDRLLMFLHMFSGLPLNANYPSAMMLPTLNAAPFTAFHKGYTKVVKWMVFT